MSNFCSLYDLTSLIKNPPCYKNPKNLTVTDLIMAKTPQFSKSLSGRDTLFQNSSNCP